MVTASYRHNGGDTHMNSQRCDSMYKTCMGLIQTKSQHEKGTCTQNLTPNRKALCNWYLMENKIHLVQWSATGYVNQKPVCGPMSKSSQTARMGLHVIPHAFLFVSALFDLVLSLLFIVCLFLERECEVEQIGRQVEYRRSWEEKRI